MHDRTKLDEDVADYLDDLRAQEELRQHKHDPLDTPLDVKIQAFTIERLRRYMAAEQWRVHGTWSLDELVNAILKSWLYGQGE